MKQQTQNKTEWKEVELGEVCEVITGGTPSTIKEEYWKQGTIPWLPSGDLKNKSIIKAHEFITELGLKNSSARIMPKETVLIALTGATTGQTGFLEIEASANQSVTGILPSKNHYPKYLFYFLQTIRKKIISQSYGGAQPHISQGYVKKLKIPLPFSNGKPDLKTQEKIASILEKAENLKQKRKNADELLDEYLKSVFNEMFGDPSNPKNKFDTISFLDCLEKEASKNNLKIQGKDFLDKGEYPIIDQGERFIAGYTNDTSKIYNEKLPVIIFGDHTRILKFVNFPFALGADGVKILVPKDEFNPPYFYYCLKLIGVKSAGYSRHYKFLKEKKIPLPPLPLQQKFAKIVEQVEKIKEKQKNSNVEINELFDALMQKAFKGELI